MFSFSYMDNIYYNTRAKGHIGHNIHFGLLALIASTYPLHDLNTKHFHSKTKSI